MIVLLLEKQISFTLTNTSLSTINFEENQAYWIIFLNTGAESWWWISEWISTASARVCSCLLFSIKKVLFYSFLRNSLICLWRYVSKGWQYIVHPGGMYLIEHLFPDSVLKQSNNDSFFCPFQESITNVKFSPFTYGCKICSK